MTVLIFGRTGDGIVFSTAEITRWQKDLDYLMDFDGRSGVIVTEHDR